MVKNPIKVVVRVRPTERFAQGAIDLHPDKKVRCRARLVGVLRSLYSGLTAPGGAAWGSGSSQLSVV